MKKITNILKFSLVLLAGGVMTAQAQFGPQASSPQVNPDNSVTFRFRAPQATSVEVE